MKETKPYLHRNTAYSIEPYFVCLHFPNLVRAVSEKKGSDCQYWLKVNVAKPKIGLVGLLFPRLATLQCWRLRNNCVKKGGGGIIFL